MMNELDRPCDWEAHAAMAGHTFGAHRDPASDFYEGPDAALGALPGPCRRAAFVVLHASRAEHWHEVEVRTALHVMAEEILRLRSQVAAVQVDRDRGIREAMTRAEDCEFHGHTIRYESHSAYAFSVLAEQHDAERVAWLSACQQIRDAFSKRDDDLAKNVVAFVDAAGRSADRARKRFSAPTLADCDKAGRCEHPAPQPHAACEQLALDFSPIGEAA